MTEKKVFKYKLCGKHAFIFYHAAPRLAAEPRSRAAHLPGRALAGRKARAIAGQEFLLFFIGDIALREQRTRFSPLSPLISSLKNKARLEEPVHAGNSPLSACFFTVLPARPRANSLLRVSHGKERRKSCPLFPCVPELDPKEEIDAGRQQPRRHAAAPPRSPPQKKESRNLDSRSLEIIETIEISIKTPIFRSISSEDLRKRRRVWLRPCTFRARCRGWRPG